MAKLEQKCFLKLMSWAIISLMNMPKGIDVSNVIFVHNCSIMDCEETCITSKV